MIRLLCVTIYIFNQTGTKTLLINHHKLGFWVPPGGKIDPNEIPDDAAIRECQEEVGLEITLLGETPSVTGGKVRPIGVQILPVIPGEKEHIDLIYVAIPTNSLPLQVNKKEAADARWLTLNEVIDSTFNTCESVRHWVKKISAEWQYITKLPMLKNKNLNSFSQPTSK